MSAHSLASKFLRMGSVSGSVSGSGSNIGSGHSLAPTPTARLFCFPFAGGSASTFAGWGDRLKPEIEVWAAQPRGRGTRFREALHSSVEEMVGDYLSVLRSHLDLPFAFYGHSLGGLMAFELTRQLEAEGLRLPQQLFIGASAPPALGLLHPKIHHLPDEPFVDAVQRRYEGIPDAVLQEPELMELFLPALKADFAAHEMYDRSRTMRVPRPIVAFAGSEDTTVRPEMLSEWEQHTSGRFQMHTVAGGHFFLTQSRDLVLATIRESMLESMSNSMPDSMLEFGREGIAEERRLLAGAQPQASYGAADRDRPA